MDLHRNIIFEWSEYEQFVYAQERLQFDARYEQGLFKLSKALGFPVVSIFVDSRISNADLDALSKHGTRTICVRSAGVDMLDIEYAKRVGISVWRVASYSPESIAEHAFALILNLARRLNVERRHHAHLQNVRTISSMGFTLKGKRLGLYGVGRIGSHMAQIADGFGMEVGFFDKFVTSIPHATKIDSLRQLFTLCDVVSVHVPLTPETRHSVNWEDLQYAKPGLLLINTARGDIVDPNSVVRALDAKLLGGFGADVWDSGRVDDKFDPRLLRDNVIQTHHVAFFTYEAVQSIIEQTFANIDGQGKPENRV